MSLTKLVCQGKLGIGKDSCSRVWLVKVALFENIWMFTLCLVKYLQYIVTHISNILLCMLNIYIKIFMIYIHHEIFEHTSQYYRVELNHTY